MISLGSVNYNNFDIVRFDVPVIGDVDVGEPEVLSRRWKNEIIIIIFCGEGCNRKNLRVLQKPNGKKINRWDTKTNNAQQIENVTRVFFVVFLLFRVMSR